MLRDNQTGYGWISITIHWLSAVVVISLFALGWWMLTLSYYDEWYRLGPWWHKSVGILLFILTVLRVLWKWSNPSPEPEGTQLEKVGATYGHLLLYLLLFTTMISGYMISTADGRPISVFGWFEVPGLSTGIERQESLAGTVHWYSALSLVVLAAGHALMALKHHYLDKHDTLKRMISAKNRGK